MRESTASRTAEHNALFRALETRRRGGLFHDPLAAAFLGPPLRAVSRLGRPASAAIDRRWPGVRTSVVARTRLIDDVVVVLAPSVDQVVLLGAGFDSRPYRLGPLAGLRVFEVDHPATQQRKRAALRRVGVSLGAVRFVPTDFNLRELDGALAGAGHDPDRPAVLLWEGVTNYLDPAAVDAGLRWCARATPGSALVLTYVDRQVLDHPERYVGADRLQATLRRAGEALTFGMAPAAMGPYLEEVGLRREWDLGAADYRALAYGEEAAARMRGHEFYRVALARVPG
jgi:methyltransferase (TIGR00027 family)